MNISINLSSKPKRNPRLRWRIYRGKAIIFPSIGLNESGTSIWLLCDGKRSVKEIIDHLAKEYDLQPDEIRDSVLEFIKDLIKNKLIVLEEE